MEINMHQIPERPTIAIVGAGPIGCILGAHLAKAGHEVHLVDIMKDHLDRIASDGLLISGTKEMKVDFPPERMHYDISDLSGKKFDVVFVSFKASLLHRVLPPLTKALGDDTVVVSLQNGLDTEDLIAQSFSKENTLRVVVNYAGNIVDNGHIRLSFFTPPNYIGMLTPKAEANAMRLAKMISDSGLQTKFTSNIKRYEWEKVILNAALSPVCALTRRTMKQMMDFEESRSLVGALLKEGIEVAMASGVEYDESFLSHCIEYLEKAGHHKTSMHIDLDRGSPTEIDFINGKIVEYGKLTNIPTPLNYAITSLIKSAELPQREDTKKLE